MKAKIYSVMSLILLAVVVASYQNCGSSGGNKGGPLTIGSAAESNCDGQNEDPCDPTTPLPVPNIPIPPPTTAGTHQCNATIELLAAWNGGSYPPIAMSPPLSWSVASLDACEKTILAYAHQALCTSIGAKTVYWWRTGNSATTQAIPFTYDGVPGARQQECTVSCNPTAVGKCL